MGWIVALRTDSRGLGILSLRRTELRWSALLQFPTCRYVFRDFALAEVEWQR